MNTQNSMLSGEYSTPVNQEPAGFPFLSIENKLGEIWVEASAIQGDCFAVQVTGDGMMDANIHDGDLVIVRRQPIAASNDIIVATLKNETIIRRLYISGNVIELRPANATRRPTSVNQGDDLRIWGKVIRVCRRGTP